MRQLIVHEDGTVTEELADADSHARKNQHAVELGRLGGRKGGRARAEALTPEQRSEIARNAARKRWHRSR